MICVSQRVLFVVRVEINFRYFPVLKSKGANKKRLRERASLSGPCFDDVINVYFFWGYINFVLT